MSTSTYKEWPIWCHRCEVSSKQLAWDFDLPITCSTCGSATCLNYDEKYADAPGVIGDELNNYAARHGVCNPDGSPRVFHSKTDLKRALNEKGLKISGDTPGVPYKV
jgi:hypothetical protein